MKKLFFAFAVTSVLLVLSSCSGKDKQNSATTSQHQRTETKKKDSIPSVVLYEEMPLYTPNSEGKMVWAASAALGDEIRLYVSGTEPDQKKAIRKLSNGEEKELDFVHVSYEDQDYWTRDIFVTKHRFVKPGVILEDTLIYENPEGAGATSKKLESLTILAVDAASIVEDEDIGISFMPVVYYNGTPFGREVYVKADAVSSSDDDVIALQTVAASKKFKSVKPEVAAQVRACLYNLSISSIVEDVVAETF